MVMEGAPSPQCVGREFVRQYYTLLNKAPEFLHRFYSHNSSFTHGRKEKSGEEDQAVVIGQTDIHKKIMSLNFRDCHAKIRYVDSQVTVETGVVVQVTGELSTAGQPLRRFMQTFVLAPQSANKYYVHNDIFRYQDEVFSDSDDEEDLAEPAVQPGVHQSADKMELNNGGDHAHDSYFVKAAGGINDQPVSQAPQAEQILEPVITNGHERPSDSPSKGADDEKQASGEARPASQAPVDEPSMALSHEEPRSFSWAGLITRTGGTAALSAGTGTPAPVTSTIAESSETEQPDALPTQQPSAGGNRGDNSVGGRLPGDMHTSGSVEERRPDRVRYTDRQQVFVGNLPPTISESELKAVFKAYGNVTEVRISRANHKPSFGFVVFEEEASAQQVLQNKKNIEYEGQRLNVEEKRKPEARVHSASRMAGRGGAGGPRHMRGGRGGGYGGPPRDDTGNRSGQGRFGGGGNRPQYHPRQ